MTRLVAIAGAALIAGIGMAGCGESKGGGTYVPPDLDPDASMGMSCVDEDNDGFGLRCPLGRDCDDASPEITDICYRCEGGEPAEGCPCEPGTESVWCDPSEVENFEGELNGETGVFKCVGGARYCRDGLWEECKGLEWVRISG